MQTATLERARTLLRDGDHIGAAAVARSAEGVESRLIEGIAMTMSGCWTDAERSLQAALAGELGERKSYAVYHLALVYERTGRPVLAADAYAAAAEAWQEQGQFIPAAKARLNACWLLVEQGNLTRASRHLDTTLTVATVAEAHKALTAYLQLRSGSASSALEMAQQVSADEPWAACLATAVVVTVTAQQGQMDAAKLAYDRGAALLPQADDARLTNMYVELRGLIA